MIRWVRLWTGDDGNSHFDEGMIDLSQGERADLMSASPGASTAAFTRKIRTETARVLKIEDVNAAVPKAQATAAAVH